MSKDFVTPNNVLGCNIKKFRMKITDIEGKYASQRECAEEIGIKQQVWARWEAGRAMPEPENLKKISGLLRVSVSQLWEDDSDNSGILHVLLDLAGVSTRFLALGRRVVHGEADIEKVRALVGVAKTLLDRAESPGGTISQEDTHHNAG